MAVSSSTNLVTEAVKKVLDICKVKYHSDILAGIVSAVLSVGVSVGYALINGISFTAPTIVCIVALMFMSWLGSMLGYDKIIKHIKSIKKDDNK